MIAAADPLPSLRAAVTPLLLDGVRINHVDIGSGPPILFLHGITATLADWRATLPFFARAHRVIALDLPGFGRSDKPDVPYDMPYFVGIVERLLDAKGIARASIAGNSMGGLIAMRFALERPSRVDRLILVAPAGITAYPRRMALVGVRLLRLLHLADAPVGREGVDPWPSLVRPPRIPREAVALLFRLVFPTEPAIAERYVRAYVAAIHSAEYELLLRATFRAGASVLRHHVGAQAAGIAVPTLILWGAKDRLLPASAAPVLRRLVAGSRLLVYGESGHCPMVDQPDRFNADLARFLRSEEIGE